MVESFWAAQALGAIAVGFNAWWVPREIEYGVEHTRPSVLIVDAKRAALLDGLDLDVPVLTMEDDLPHLVKSSPVQSFRQPLSPKTIRR